MPSLIPGYEYDIFISYRQKDNKHDGWVTEFVNNLKGELESTFKEEVSVYFDINPRDGLLETHDVDASLKEKLKCLIFIPIISRTYCDPKSFAWEHEFRAFIELAKNDQFGLKVKIQGGNVASRVLPVQIHDLDAEDKKLVEHELGGFLRGIEFVYKEPGVNRPLRSNEDHPQDNLNRTFYRDQINKVANAVKEIIAALKKQSQPLGEISQEAAKPVSLPQKNRKKTIIAGSFIAVVLIILGILFIPKLFKPAEPEKSIAVLPFIDDSPDKNNSHIINGLMDEILINLQKIKEFNVKSRNSSELYRGKDRPSTTEIARKLHVNFIVEGSGQQYGENIRLRVQLIEISKRNERHRWGEVYEKKITRPEDYFDIQSDVAESIASALKVILTPEEKQLISKIPTKNLTALGFYQTGREEYWKYQTDPHNLTALNKAEDLYKKALQHDPGFAKAYVGLAEVYWNKNYVAEYLSENFMDSAMVLADTALSYDADLAEAYVLRGDYYLNTGYSEQALKEYDRALGINPSAWQAYAGRVKLYINNDLLNAIRNMHEILLINRGRELPYVLEYLGNLYVNAGFPEIAIQYYQEKLTLDNDSVAYFLKVGGAENNYIKAYMLDSTNLEVLFQLGIDYSFTGQYKESLFFLEKWLEQLDQTLVGRDRYNGMHRVGYAYWKNNRFDEANYYFDLQIKYNNGEINSNLPPAQAYYSYYDRAGVYAFRGEREKAYEDLRVFNQRPIEHKWMVNLIKADPLFDSIRDEPEFQQIVRDVEARYQTEHERVRKWLEERGEL